jgi:hypothetical protein
MPLNDHLRHLPTAWRSRLLVTVPPDGLAPNGGYQVVADVSGSGAA